MNNETRERLCTEAKSMMDGAQKLRFQATVLMEWVRLNRADMKAVTEAIEHNLQSVDSLAAFLLSHFREPAS
jgi:hypothetical protein